MLLSLRGAIRQDVKSYMHKTNVIIEGLGVKVDDIKITKWRMSLTRIMTWLTLILS